MDHLHSSERNARTTAVVAAKLKVNHTRCSMRSAARALLATFVIILLCFVGLSYWNGTIWQRFPRAVQEKPVGTTGALIDRTLDRTRETLDDARLSSKIKAKMMLDDTVKARNINVTTHDSVVTLTGVVASVGEHDRAMQLARETVGVREVVDRIGVQPETHAR